MPDPIATSLSRLSRALDRIDHAISRAEPPPPATDPTGPVPANQLDALEARVDQAMARLTALLPPPPLKEPPNDG